MEKVVDMIPGINFVEQRHQDEYIENHGEVNVACSRLGTLIFGTLKQKMSKKIVMKKFLSAITCYSSTVNIKHFLPIEENKEDHCELVECLPKSK